MRIKFITCYVILISFFMAGCIARETKIVNLSNNILKSKFYPDLVKVLASSSKFKEKSFSKKQLKNYSNNTIEILYKALNRTAFLFPEQKKYIIMQEKVLEEKIRRNIHDARDIKHLNRRYLRARMFKKVSSIQKRFPDDYSPSMPKTIIANNPLNTLLWQGYEIFNSGEKAKLKILSMQEGPKVVLIIIVGCSGAETALTDILADSELSKVFRKYGMVLTTYFDPKSLSLWKNHFNFSEVYIANKASDFPGFDFRASPKLYFLRDGEIKFNIEGWSTSKLKEKKAEMRKGFEAISVFPPSPTVITITQ